MEPHFLFPLWQFLPICFRAALHRRFKLGWMERQPDPLLARAGVEQVRLVNISEMAALFAGAQIVPERVAGLTKSLIALRPKA